MTKAEQLHKNKEPKLRQRKCKQCRQWFTPDNKYQETCSVECAIEYAPKKMAKEKRKSIRRFRESDKSKLKRDVQRIANRLGKLHNMIRGYKECITCGSYSKLQMDGGHCFPTSTYSPIRYYTLQIRPQCVKCNRFNGGSPKEFKVYLISELGSEKVEWLESHKGITTKKFTVEYLQKYKRVMGKRLRMQEKRYNATISKKELHG